MSDSLWPRGLQHARPPCPSPSPGVNSNSCPLSRWCHPTISSSVVPSPPAFNLTQHQGLFQWVSPCIWWPRYWSFSISPNEYSELISYRIDWFDLIANENGARITLMFSSLRKEPEALVLIALDISVLNPHSRPDFLLCLVWALILGLPPLSWEFCGSFFDFSDSSLFWWISCFLCCLWGERVNPWSEFFLQRKVTQYQYICMQSLSPSLFSMAPVLWSVPGEA